jgi:hypothetical protein
MFVRAFGLDFLAAGNPRHRHYVLRYQGNMRSATLGIFVALSFLITATAQDQEIPASPAFDKLADAAKLWAYVKYFHTRVTMPDVDWDRAFMDAAPKDSGVRQ